MMSQNIKHKNDKDPDSMVIDKALNIAQGIKQVKQKKITGSGLTIYIQID